MVHYSNARLLYLGTGENGYTTRLGYNGRLLYLGTINNSTVRLSPPEKFPSVWFRAEPLVTLGGYFRRRGGSTGPTGGASTILIPHYLKRRTGPKMHLYVS